MAVLLAKAVLLYKMIIARTFDAIDFTVYCKPQVVLAHLQPCFPFQAIVANVFVIWVLNFQGSVLSQKFCQEKEAY